MSKVKQQVREFYDQVGWQKVAGDLYQNARYEDLRPVSSEYIHRCHLRVKRRLPQTGKYLLDAGSGPVQYAEYLTYSKDHAYRVCADISIVALIEARQRVGERGLFVVADVANLPFRADAFDGAVSLHTLHHLPFEDQLRAYAEIYRVLSPDRTAVLVNGWTDSPLMRNTNWLVRLAESFGGWIARLRGRPGAEKRAKNQTPVSDASGTFIRKLDAGLLHSELDGKMRIEIGVWRSVSVRWLRALVHTPTGGRLFLKLLFALEERYPRWFGEKGQYPLVVVSK
jgi:ubiquinone/menaquinone biosynthesis C-methylase UbiE